MKFGATIGCEVRRAEILQKVGYDYAEISLADLAKMEEKEYAKFLREMQALRIPCEAACIMLPHGLYVSDPATDKEEINSYLETAYSRAEELGIQTVVFGSGRWRNVPEHVDIHDGFNALLRFLSEAAGPAAERHHLRIAIEPLRSQETNVIHTVKEAVALAKLSKCDSVRGLADVMHMHDEGDDISNLYDLGGWIIHAHTSCPIVDPRAYPTHDDGYDQIPFMRAIYKTGCTRMSVEAHIRDEYYEQDAAEALYTLIDAYDAVIAE